MADPDKATTQRSREELLQWVKAWQRGERDRKIRAGKARPRTQREMRMYLDARAQNRDSNLNQA